MKAWFKRLFCPHTWHPVVNYDWLHWLCPMCGYIKGGVKIEELSDNDRAILDLYNYEDK